MKSYPKVVPAAQAQAFIAWAQDDLHVPDAALRSVEIEAILTLFRAPEEHAARLGENVLSWMPEEFCEIAPFAFPLLETESDGSDFGEPELPDQRSLLANAEHEAEMVLQTARAQATQIMLQAQRTVDEMIADARQEIASARDTAYRQGIETAHDETSSMLETVHAVVEETRVWKEALVEQSTPLIIEMVTEIARKMFGDGVVLSDQALQQNLNRVLTSGKSLGELNIYLNPQDAATLDSAWRDLRSITTGSRVRILPAEEIKRGGCYIQGQMGAIDARVETQLKSVLEAFAQEPADQERDQ